MPSSSGRSLVVACLVGVAACRTPAPPARAAVDATLVGAVNHGVAQMGRYDFSAAATEFGALAADHPDSPEIALDLALALMNRQRDGDGPAAEALLRRVLDRPTVATRAQYALGLLLLYGGRDGEAAPLFQGVAGKRADDAFPAYFAGQARLAAAPGEALEWFSMASTRDPLLRSAHYGAFQALQRLGRTADAAAALARFQALETDPRATVAEFKYTRMGALADAVTLDAPTPPAPRPPGATFADPTPLAAAGSWAPRPDVSITAADLSGDGVLDLFITGAGGPTPNAVLLGTASGFSRDTAHPLATVPDVRAALWGDVDNDGRLDVVLVGARGTTALWRQDAQGRWRDVTLASKAATPSTDAVDGALFDADHDGDLDIFLVNGRGPNELLNNNGDGTFRAIGRTSGVAGDGRPSTGVAVVDLDGDRDHDLVVLKASPPHEIWRNDRVWHYQPAPGFDALRGARLAVAMAADLDANGAVELYTDGERGLERWTRPAAGAWAAERLAAATPAPRHQLAIADVQGDGRLDLVVSRGTGWAALDVTGGDARPVHDASTATVQAWTLVTRAPERGPVVVAMGADAPLEWDAGPGRLPFLALAPTGRDSRSDQLRSNVSGIGTKVAVRTGTRWTAFDTARVQSGPGQSLQPMAVGLGGASGADFVSLTWSDGVLQTEIGLAAGRVHRIEETQRQLSSCPVLFAFDGTSTRFVTDILGVGGIGFFEQPGVYSAPFPREHVLLPDGAIGADHGVYRLVIGEPMEEVAYFDQFALAVYDLPPGWQMALDERKAIAGPLPTGAPVFFREERLPVRAVNDRGVDVTALVTTADLKAAPPGLPDARYIGMTEAHTLELHFDADVERGPGRPVLMLDGWVEYPYAQTVFAAWQAGAAYAAPSLEARDRSGRWHTVAPDFGYPAGMPRRMTLPLSRLPAHTVALRLRTTQEIYWDRAAVVYAEHVPDVRERVLPLTGATLRASGFAARTTGPQRTPHYDYARRAPLWDTRHPRGWYTRFGNVQALVQDADDAVAVIGPGEEVAVEFAAAEAPLPDGWRRRFVFRARGWCKDMDLYTRDGDTVEPLPGASTAARQRLHAAYNTRYEGGR